MRNQLNFYQAPSSPARILKMMQTCKDFAANVWGSDNSDVLDCFWRNLNLACGPRPVIVKANIFQNVQDHHRYIWRRS